MANSDQSMLPPSPYPTQSLIAPFPLLSSTLDSIAKHSQYPQSFHSIQLDSHSSTTPITLSAISLFLLGLQPPPPRGQHLVNKVHSYQFRLSPGAGVFAFAARRNEQAWLQFSSPSPATSSMPPTSANSSTHFRRCPGHELSRTVTHPLTVPLLLSPSPSSRNPPPPYHFFLFRRSCS